MVTRDKGEDLTNRKGVRSEKIQCEEEGPSETSYCSPRLPTTGLNNSSYMSKQEIPVSSFLMAPCFPLFPHFSVGFAFPQTKAKRFHSQEIPLSLRVVNRLSQIVLFIPHSFIQPSSEHLLPERLSVSHVPFVICKNTAPAFRESSF